jgi:hypothetical protein
MKTTHRLTADFSAVRPITGVGPMRNQNPTLAYMADETGHGNGYRAVELRAWRLNSKIIRLDIDCRWNKGKRENAHYANVLLGPVARAALVAQLAPELIEAMRLACDAQTSDVFPTMREFLANLDSVKDPTGLKTRVPLDPEVNRSVPVPYDWRGE